MEKPPCTTPCLTKERNDDVIQILIDAGADPTLADNDGNTSLDCVSGVKSSKKQ